MITKPVMKIFERVVATQEFADKDKEALVSKIPNLASLIEVFDATDAAGNKAWDQVRTIIICALLALDENAFHMDVPAEIDSIDAISHIWILRAILTQRQWNDLRTIIECRLASFGAPTGDVSIYGRHILGLLNWSQDEGFLMPLSLDDVRFPAGIRAERNPSLREDGGDWIDISVRDAIRAYDGRMRDCNVFAQMGPGATGRPARTASTPPGRHATNTDMSLVIANVDPDNARRSMSTRGGERSMTVSRYDPDNMQFSPIAAQPRGSVSNSASMTRGHTYSNLSANYNATSHPPALNTAFVATTHQGAYPMTVSQGWAATVHEVDNDDPHVHGSIGSTATYASANDEQIAEMTNKLANLDSAVAIMRDQTTKSIVAAEVHASEVNTALEEMYAAFDKVKADTQALAAFARSQGVSAEVAEERIRKMTEQAARENASELHNAIEAMTAKFEEAMRGVEDGTALSVGRVRSAMEAVQAKITRRDLEAQQNEARVAEMAIKMADHGATISGLREELGRWRASQSFSESAHKGSVERLEYRTQDLEKAMKDFRTAIAEKEVEGQQSALYATSAAAKDIIGVREEIQAIREEQVEQGRRLRGEQARRTADERLRRDTEKQIQDRDREMQKLILDNQELRRLLEQKQEVHEAEMRDIKVMLEKYLKAAEAAPRMTQQPRADRREPMNCVSEPAAARPVLRRVGGGAAARPPACAQEAAEEDVWEEDDVEEEDEFEGGDNDDNYDNNNLLYNPQRPANSARAMLEQLQRDLLEGGQAPRGTVVQVRAPGIVRHNVQVPRVRIGTLKVDPFDPFRADTWLEYENNGNQPAQVNKVVSKVRGIFPKPADATAAKMYDEYSDKVKEGFAKYLALAYHCQEQGKRVPHDHYIPLDVAVLQALFVTGSAEATRALIADRNTPQTTSNSAPGVAILLSSMHKEATRKGLQAIATRHWNPIAEPTSVVAGRGGRAGGRGGRGAGRGAARGAQGNGAGAEAAAPRDAGNARGRGGQ